MGTAAAPGSPARAGLPSPDGAPGCPVRRGHPGLCIHPPLLLIPAGIFPVLRAVGCIFQILGPLLFPPQIPRPPHPIPAMGKGCDARTLALPWVGRGVGGEQLAGPGSCEVQGCQGEEPRLQGRHGKAVSKCYPDPSCRQPRSAPPQDFWPPSGPGGRQMGLQQGPLCPAGHRLCQECPSARAESPGSECEDQP